MQPTNGLRDKIHLPSYISPAPLVGLLIVITGLAASWGSLNTKMESNSELLSEILANQRQQAAVIELVRLHQLSNEFLIDQHSVELEQIEEKSGLRVSKHRRASPDPEPVQ